MELVTDEPKVADTVQVEMPLIINFPIAMFLKGGSVEHMRHRSKFISQVMSADTWSRMYDQYAERAREELVKEMPDMEIPPLEKLGAVIFDTSAIAKAAEPDEPEGEADEESIS